MRGPPPPGCSGAAACRCCCRAAAGLRRRGLFQLLQDCICSLCTMLLPPQCSLHGCVFSVPLVRKMLPLVHLLSRPPLPRHGMQPAGRRADDGGHPAEDPCKGGCHAVSSITSHARSIRLMIRLVIRLVICPTPGRLGLRDPGFVCSTCSARACKACCRRTCTGAASSSPASHAPPPPLPLPAVAPRGEKGVSPPCTSDAVARPSLPLLSCRAAWVANHNAAQLRPHADSSSSCRTPLAQVRPHGREV